MGISIVSLRNEGFPPFCLCLTTGCHLGLWRNCRIREADGYSRTPPGAMLRRPFRYRRSFMYAAVSDISYIAESFAWEKESGSVARNCGPSNIWRDYCAILTVT